MYRRIFDFSKLEKLVVEEGFPTKKNSICKNWVVDYLRPGKHSSKKNIGTYYPEFLPPTI